MELARDFSVVIRIIINFFIQKFIRGQTNANTTLQLVKTQFEKIIKFDVNEYIGFPVSKQISLFVNRFVLFI